MEYGLCPDVANRVSEIATLHDAGKIAVPETILNKPGELTPREFEIVKTHTTAGAELLADMPGELGKMARLCALYHHEHWAGTGYWGKYTDELPIYVSVIAVVDVYTALIHVRPYKHAWTQQEALDYIASQSGRQFSPVLAGAFLSFMRKRGGGD